MHKIELGLTSEELEVLKSNAAIVECEGGSEGDLG